MLIELSKVDFTSDFFSAMLPDGSYLVLNRLDESFVKEGETEEFVIKSINVEIQDIEGNVTKCPCIIGMSNDLMEIKTDYKEYEGTVLSPDNMAYCTIEVYEQ